MRLSTVITALLSALFALSLAIVTKAVNPAETVNGIWLVVSSACFFIIIYRLYGRFLAARVLRLDDRRMTPAVAVNDGKDFHPTNSFVLFGHHFAAIAGAGPLIGPVLAAQFGYLPGFLWILIGAAFAGAVHDMVILAASVRRGGSSLAAMARAEVGPVAGFTAALAILFIIIVALAGLGLAVVNALYKSPWGAFTIFATIPIALFMGLYLYKIRRGRVAEVSVIGVTLLFAVVIGGRYVPGSMLEPLFSLERQSLILVLAAYGFAASVLPVWMLLCPRDYLSTYMKIGTVLVLALGVIVMAPEIRMPAVTPFIHGGGPVIPGSVFPFMFITIACGAISGFHSLISSGTTPKMIVTEGAILPIGFGAMLAEGFVAIMAVIAATVLMPGDYFAINTTLSTDILAEMGFAPVKLGELSRMVGVDVAGRPGGAVSLAVGMSYIFSGLSGLKGLMPYWYNFALMFEALFILTTVDTGTRVARFILQEFGARLYAPLGRTDWMPGVIITSAAAVAAWAGLVSTGSIATVWPMFGVANQLLAVIALTIGTTILLKTNKARYAWTTLAPLAFMFVMTLTASWELFLIFAAKASEAAEPGAAFTYRLDAALVALMAVLAVVAVADSAFKWQGLLSRNKDLEHRGLPAETTED